ncbi:MAG: hypothetical protein JNM64_10645, partial [Chloroflexia bacterium]|nr:hypothetical protein [Chloroflexia bacterium]
MVEQADIRAALQALLLRAGRADGWLTQQRWYADKGRAITSSEVMALRLEAASEGTLALVVVQFRFADGGFSRYFLPLHLTENAGSPAALLGHLGDVAVLDATAQPWFGDWLLRAFQEQEAGWAADLGPGGAEY